MLLTTSDQVIEALRARKDALQLSNAVVEELAGMAVGHVDKVLGPARTRGMSLDVLLAITGALGLAVQFVSDPQTTVARRWERRAVGRAHPNTRISREALRKSRPIVLAAAATKAAIARWSGKTPEQRQAHIAMMNIARAARRLARKSKAA